MAAESRGMLIVRSDDTSIYFSGSLFDITDTKITAGSTSLRIWHVVPASGALEAYDFNDDTFKTTALTTATVAMTHRQVDNNTYNTGVWTYRHATLTDFEKGDKYIAEISHASLPRPIQYTFQYGDCEGDQRVDIPDDVWDEDVTGHVAASSAGAALDALGTDIDGRANNANLNALLGIADAAGNDLSDEVWDEDITGHVAASSAGAALDALGTDIDGRTNYPSLNDLLGVPDSPGATVSRVMVAGEADAGSTAAMLRDAARAEADDYWTGQLLVMRSGNNAGLSRFIVDFIAATDDIYVHPAFPNAIAAGDDYEILSDQSSTDWISHRGTATAGTANTISLQASAEAVVDDYYNGCVIEIISGTGAGQSRVITGYDATGGATERLATVSRNWGTNPDSTSVYVLMPADAYGQADVNWDEDITGHVAANSAGAALDALGTAIDGRANNANLNALLGVPDVAGVYAADIALAGSAQAGSSTTDIVDAVNLTQADADYWVGGVVHIISGAAAGQSRPIYSFDQVTDTITVAPAFTSAVGAGDEYIITRQTSVSTVSFASLAAIADVVWDEDIVAAHGAASTAGLLLRALGADISTRANNATLEDLLGVPDTAATDTVCGQVWEETLAGHNTAGSMGEVMNNIHAAGYPTDASIADAVWDEDIVAAHGAGDAAGLLLRVLGEDISNRANNATLNDLLGVADLAGYTIADTVWREDISTMTTVDTAANLVLTLAKSIQDRANNNDLNDLLGVVDSVGADIAWTIWDEVIDAVAHTTADSAGQRLTALDVLLEAGGAGDAAETHDQAMKLDQDALLASTDPSYDADSVAGKLDAALAILAIADRDIVTSVNIEGNDIRITCGVEQYGVIETTPWVQCSAQVFDESGAIIHNIGVVDFGAINARGFFEYTQSPHSLTSGQTYQITVTITDGALTTYQNTKIFKVVNV